MFSKNKISPDTLFRTWPNNPKDNDTSVWIRRSKGGSYDYSYTKKGD